ncbi:MAG: lytic transglycosylase domain-containing protein [Bacteroidia bacterium]|jgi:hypothetical protein|tara:strand:- start:24095 stop:24994 length:900 start_codon:yes stop_codon:yes gene_type:complete
MLKNATILVLTVITVGLLSISSKDTEKEDQAIKMEKGLQVYPVPIPSNLSFAEESVPLNKYGIKERLDRELLVNTYWQSNTMIMLKRSKRVFSVVEPILAQHGIPDDFKYLAVAESGLVNVTSHLGAKGVWQFMKSSGKDYGLRINDQVDERLHLEKSTKAACIYLKEAYERFGTWSLAAASYNRGMAGIRRDLTKQFVADYYDLHLNTETSRYMLRLLALKQIFDNPIDFGFHIEDKDYYTSEAFVHIVVDKDILNISEYARSIGTNYHILKSMNPWIKGNELLVSDGPYTIKAPLQK